MMKYNVILFMMIMLAFVGCHQQEVDTAFEDRNGIYFAGRMVGGSFQSLDSISFSFGLRPDVIRFDTVRLKVTFIGRTSPEVRKFKVKIVEKSAKSAARTDMEEGIHYQLLQTEYEFAPNSYETTMEVIIDRSQFSTSFLKAEERVMILQLVENEDFYAGIDVAQELIVRVNNYLAKPIWWDLDGFYNMEKKLGFYHPEKWKALIYVDEGFANPEELPFDKNNGMVMTMKIESARNLDPWWPKIDEETGDAIYFDKIEPANK